ncbi:hypothetical protein acsn021_33940 [Anaerocolumna cellulosilytica]|uniref:Uncharacterized protein n=1 Tax=Anaerocolumna cellulosilytica TaxID=433286 RepID=A0A6S6R9K8_9FIRM|nr:MerR family transcriptional regulator [Anaerocolumna cellulosilytica]MBB5196781.1 flagellar operon protein (TIGR03826 family) [Anaerocolumna cellulosilytica]BCJ95825.1 hypothetical protein acsn021_33940 [Anaerocolumna cellulosilytica]
MNENTAANLQSCARCGGMFWYQGTGKRICSKCKKEDDEQFEIVKSYIYENLSATIMDVSKETGVRVARIKAFLREGRLVIPDNSAIFLNCEACGTSIKFGRICRTCADTLTGEIKKAMDVSEYEIGEKPNLNSGKMRFLTRDNN